VKDKDCKAFNKVIIGFYGMTESYTLTEIRALLLPFLPYLIDLYEKVLVPEQGSPVVHGSNIYGGYADEDVVKQRIDYISDRWRCDWRVRYLINLLDADYIYTDTESEE
jgi:hypothetical protein